MVYFLLSLPQTKSITRISHANTGGSWQEQSAIAAREADAYFDPPNVASPAPEYTERASPDSRTAGVTGNSRNVRMDRTRQRFQSLSFEGEEGLPAPPPEYAEMGGGNRQRVSSNVPSPQSSPRST